MVTGTAVLYIGWHFNAGSAAAAGNEIATGICSAVMRGGGGTTILGWIFVDRRCAKILTAGKMMFLARCLSA